MRERMRTVNPTEKMILSACVLMLLSAPLAAFPATPAASMHECWCDDLSKCPGVFERWCCHGPECGCSYFTNC